MALKTTGTPVKKLNVQWNQKQTLLGLAVILCASFFLVYHALYGISTPDESFYLTIPYRLMHGDALLIHEWHVTQFSSLLQYLPTLIFVKLTGSWEGILLFWRMLFVVCQVFVSCFVFFSLKEFGFLSALGSALLFELYVPELVESLDYYTMSIMAVAVVSLLLFLRQTSSPFVFAFCGIVFACAVISVPTLALLYFAYAVLVVVMALKKKKSPAVCTTKAFAWITAGIIVVAAIVLAFFLSKGSLGDYLHAIPNLFRSGEYSSSTLFGYHKLFKMMFKQNAAAFVASLVLVLLLLIDKKRSDRALFWSILCGLAAAVYTVVSLIHFAKGDAVSLLFFPYIVAFLGISSYLLSKNKDKRLLAVWLSGLLYILLLGLVSDAMNYVGVIGFVVSNLASVPCMFRLIAELKESCDKEAPSRKTESLIEFYVFAVLSSFVVVAVLGSSALILFSRDPASKAFERGDDSPYVMVDRGAYKGIRITEHQKEVYDAVLSDIAEIEKQTDGPYTVISDDSWYLFSSDRAPLAHTLWYIQTRLFAYDDYYAYHDQDPDMIYIIDKNFYYASPGSKINVEEQKRHFTKLFDCTVTEGNAGLILKVNKEK